MADTLEEHVLSSIDVLFQGARFLAGGTRRDAEQLLEDTVLTAYHGTVRSGTPLDERGLSVLMARTFLAQMSAPSASPPNAALPSSSLDLTADGIFEASARVSPRARAALWLVLVRRWRYADTCEALRMSEAELRECLVEAQGFMSAFRSVHHPDVGSAGR